MREGINFDEFTGLNDGRIRNEKFTRHKKKAQKVHFPSIFFVALSEIK